MSGAALFWTALLFLLPALLILGYALRGQPAHARRPSASAWAGAVILVVAAGLAIAIGRALGDEGLESGLTMTAWGAAAVYLAFIPLGLRRPREGSLIVLASALVLPVWIFVLGPLFLTPIDPHEVPPGTNPATFFWAAFAFGVLYAMPALLAGGLFAAAAHGTRQQAHAPETPHAP